MNRSEFIIGKKRKGIVYPLGVGDKVKVMTSYSNIHAGRAGVITADLGLSDTYQQTMFQVKWADGEKSVWGRSVLERV